MAGVEVKRPRLQELQELCEKPTTIMNVRNTRPQQALDALREALPNDEPSKALWRQQARLAVVLGSCPRSLAGLKSGSWLLGTWSSFACSSALRGLRHWLPFLDIAYGRDQAKARAFPAQVEDVLAWSNLFRRDPLAM